MTDIKDKKIAFTMVVDEERCELLQIMCSALMMNMTDFAMSHPDRVETVVRSMKVFIDEFSEKQHEMGWCHDDTCKYHEKKKND